GFAAHPRGLVAITLEVALAKLFPAGPTVVSVVKVNLRHTNSMLGKKVRDGYVVAIFFPLQIVLYQNERLLCRATDPIVFAVRSAFLNRRDFDLGDIQARE